VVSAAVTEQCVFVQLWFVFVSVWSAIVVAQWNGRP